MTNTVISAKGLTKHYTNQFALNNFSFELGAGRIMGLIGPNGAGKTTALRCLMGMTTFQGSLSVLGMDPRIKRTELLRDVAYIADSAILPSWMTVAQLLEYTKGVHPNFQLERALTFLSQTEIQRSKKIGALSKGMITQLHLAIAISVDAKLLVLDEPTLGLDILYRKRFYQQLMNDYFDEQRTVLITTHQVEEVEHLLTDLLFIKRGSVALNMDMESLSSRYLKLEVYEDCLASAESLQPIYTEKGLGKTVFLFENINRNELSPLGKVSPPSVADLFVALMGR